MPNTNPADAECEASHLTDSCGCSECGALDRDDLAPLTLPSGRVVQACGECRAPVREVDGDMCRTCGEDGFACRCAVPVEVEDEATVRERTTWDREALALVKIETAAVA